MQVDGEVTLREKFGDELESKISEKQKAFSGLLTREGSLKLLAIEEGIIPAKAGKAQATPLSQAIVSGDSSVSIVAKVKQVFCAKDFDKGGRGGKVCNVILSDGSAEAKLVLWNSDVDFAERKLERNSCIKAEGLAVKNGELHSSLFSSIALAEAPLGFPDFSTAPKKLSEVGEGDDFYARVSSKSSLREFEKNGAKGSVLNLTVEDESGQKTLVCWGRNAVIANFLKEGDVVKVEGANAKNGEIHATWYTHLIAHAKHHNLRELEFKSFSSLVSGESAFVQVVVEKLFEARVSRKCVSCGAAVEEGEEKCGCGGSVRQVFFVTAEAKDASDREATARMVFFEEQARDFIGLKRTLVSPKTIFGLKRDYLQGKALKVKALAKRRTDGALELVVKQVRSH